MASAANTTTNATLEVSTVQETVTVRASPIVDTRETGTKTTSTSRRCRTSRRRATHGSCSSGRPASPWTAPTSAATSRASSPATSRAARRPATTSGPSTASTSPTWPPPARRPSTTTSTCSKKCRSPRAAPTSRSRPAASGINLVTKSGTDSLQGLRPLPLHGRQVRGSTTSREELQGAGRRARRADPEHQGLRLRRRRSDRARARRWYWGSYGTQDIKVGVVGFYEKTPGAVPTACRSTGARSLSVDGAAQLPLDRPDDRSNNYNVQADLRALPDNRFNFQNTWAEKVRNARDASDIRPIETTYRQKAVSSDFGASAG